MRFRLLAEAETEIEEAREYLNSQVPDLGARFLDDLELSFREIRMWPRRFPKIETLPRDEPYQRAILSVFRFTVIYECLADEILIVAVAHSSRQPNYWLSRRD